MISILLGYEGTFFDYIFTAYGSGLFYISEDPVTHIHKHSFIFVYLTEWQRMTERLCTNTHKKIWIKAPYVKTELITVLKQHTVNKIPIAQLTRDDA